MEPWPSYSPDCNPIEHLWQQVQKEATHWKYCPDFAQLQAEVDRALLHGAQTPREITGLMARYCETLGAKAASWRTKHFQKVYINVVTWSSSSILTPDLRTAKTRPALIVQADNLQTGLSQVIVAMITSRRFRANHPSRVIVEVSTPIGQRTGLLTDSVVMTDNLATVAEVAIDRVIGTLPMTDVDTALRHTLKL